MGPHEVKLLLYREGYHILGREEAYRIGKIVIIRGLVSILLKYFLMQQQENNPI